MWASIEICSGVLTGPTRTECAGVVTLSFENIGRRIFLVDAIEPDGGRITLHDTFNYAEAMIAAEESGREDGIPVHDLVLGGAP